MPEKKQIQLGDVQKTMLLPLWGRAVETHKAKPLLTDPVAANIVERIDLDFSTFANNLSPLTQAAWIMRSLFVDRVVREFLAQCPDGSVMNVGCGLDTTFDRVDNGRVRWYDLDLPDAIALRREFIPESERRRFICASLLDEGWLAQVGQPESVLLIAAGVLYYFSADQVKAFLIRLADHFPGCQAIFDVSSPYGVKVANRMVIQKSGLDERSNLKWGLTDPAELLAWDPRFRLVKTLYYFRQGGPWPINLKLVGLFSDWMKIQYMIHLAL